MSAVPLVVVDVRGKPDPGVFRDALVPGCMYRHEDMVVLALNDGKVLSVAVPSDAALCYVPWTPDYTARFFLIGKLEVRA